MKLEVEVVNGVVRLNNDAERFLTELRQYEVQKVQMENNIKLFKQAVDEAFKKAGTEKHTIGMGGVTLVYKKPSTRTTIDSKRLKAEMPDLAAEYSKTTDVPESWSISYDD